MKIIRGNINTRYYNPKDTSGLGQKYLIEKWLNDRSILRYKINADLTIDVNGIVLIENIEDGKFPDYIQFNTINGDFDCHSNNLISLIGGPLKIAGNYNCRDNKLSTLQHCPKIIPGWFNCSFNLLKTLEYCPKYVGKNFSCRHNKKQFTEGYVRSCCEVKEMIEI
jgi:hypothetical protein